ncbi:hypothetical protein GCM10020331_094310 [Ectobacillus funiculus]
MGVKFPKSFIDLMKNTKWWGTKLSLFLIAELGTEKNKNFLALSLFILRKNDLSILSSKRVIRGYKSSKRVYCTVD